MVTGMLAVTLAGCGHAAGGNPLGLPSATSPPSARSAASSAPRAVTTMASPAPNQVPGASARRGAVTGSARRHDGLVDAVVDYMQVRVRIGNTWRVDEQALADVATGRAAREARRRADTMRAGDRHVVGAFVVNASRASVAGDRGEVTGCMVDHTSEVDRAGQVVIDPPGGRLATLQLRRDGDRWRVSDVPHDVPPFCSGPAS